MTWYIIECTRGSEKVCAKRLEAAGYPGAWFPSKKIDNRTRANKRRNPHPTRFRHVAIVPGYLFLEAETIACHIINNLPGNLWFNVLAPGGVPYKLTDDDMARMRQVPKRIKALVDEIKNREYEERMAKLPIVGHDALITDGPFEGQRGQVISMSGDMAEIDTGGVVGYVTVSVAIAERAA